MGKAGGSSHEVLTGRKTGQDCMSNFRSAIASADVVYACLLQLRHDYDIQ